jgi:DNA-binding response OmpR family regulator
MINLMFFRGTALSDEELLSAFSKAGYRVAEVNTAANSSRYVLHEDGSTHLETRLHEVHALLDTLAATHWELSMRARTLISPRGQAVSLTSLEFSFIKLLATSESGVAVSRKTIVQVFGEDYLSYDQNRLDTMVKRLRHKVQTRTGTALPLHTVRVKGFAFDDVIVIVQ